MCDAIEKQNGLEAICHGARSIVAVMIMRAHRNSDKNLVVLCGNRIPRYTVLMDTRRFLIGMNRACWVGIPIVAALVGGVVDSNLNRGYFVEGSIVGLVIGLLVGRLVFWVIKGFVHGDSN